MVVVTAPTNAKRNRITNNLLLLVFAACFLIGTMIIVSEDQEEYEMEYVPPPSSSKPGVFDGAQFSADPRSAKYHLDKPKIIYGTAGKKDDTARLVTEAIRAGFRFIDTACQPKHYNEKGVGEGWTAAARELGLNREDVWLQSKFTPYWDQDPNDVPYDPNLSIADQAWASLEASLKNLQTDYLDSWIMHSIPQTVTEIMEVWRVMEQAYLDGIVRNVGASNFNKNGQDIDIIRVVYMQLNVDIPVAIQQEFSSRTKFDLMHFNFARTREIRYQSYGILTGNREALDKPEIQKMAKKKGLTPEDLMFAFMLENDFVDPISGTTSPKHMAENIAMVDRYIKGEKIFSTDYEKFTFGKLVSKELEKMYFNVESGV